MTKSFAALVLAAALALPGQALVTPATDTAPATAASTAPLDEASLRVVGFTGFNRLPYQQVAIKLSQPGESLDDFVVRVAPIFDAFTARTEWEACGMLAQDATGRYALVIGTLQAALSCGTSRDNVPEGFTAIGQTVHSHPRTKTVRPTPSDLEIQRQSGLRGLPYKAVESNKGAKSFSPEDFAAGPGYLVSAGRILHQAGLKTVRTVGELEDLAPIRHFAQR